MIENWISDIQEGNFFESDILYFPDIRPDSEKVFPKKKDYREKNFNV